MKTIVGYIAMYVFSMNMIFSDSRQLGVGHLSEILFFSETDIVECGELWEYPPLATSECSLCVLCIEDIRVQGYLTLTTVGSI